jgi:hypothetical protein
VREKKTWKAKAIKGKRVSFPDLKRGNIAGGEDETDFMWMFGQAGLAHRQM